MTRSSENNKRIAKNTLFLYMRMVLIMAVTLYTSRVVLAELGIDDYGVYMVVGGVVAMFSFLNSCMSTATQRFLNFELGNPDSSLSRLRDVFSTSVSIHLVICLSVVVLAETVGLWFVNHKLVIPEESMAGANIVYQAAIASFCVTIMQVPFNAAIIAHEKMQIYALVSIVEALFKLGIAYMLIVLKEDRLAWYGVMVLAVHLVIALIYAVICLRKFRECTLRPRYIPGKFQEMLKFAGWNLFGSIAWLVRGQGMGIILNIFFGPALNAAKGVADQVSSAVNNLNSNFQVALNPQITKNYASGKIQEMELLAYRGIKFSCLLLWLMALPIILNVNEILDIWLEKVPEYSSIFVILILLDVISGSLFGSPFMTSLAATGNIRTYQISVSCVLLMILPAAYVALRCGMPPQSIFYLNILFSFLSGCLRFWFCRHQINFSARFYLRYAFLPVIILILTTLLPCYMFARLVGSWHIPGFATLTVNVIVSIICVGTTGWFVTLNRSERSSLRNIMTKRFKKNG